MNRVLLSLGSNIDSETNLREALRRLASRCRVLAVSPVYETAPVGNPAQPAFLNAAALIETELTADALKTRVLRAIEQELGRVRRDDRNAPRTIDLDIALVVASAADAGPAGSAHPDILRYAHVAVPLADIAPQARHPATGTSLREIARGLVAGGMVARPDIVLWPIAAEHPPKES